MTNNTESTTTTKATATTPGAQDATKPTTATKVASKTKGAPKAKKTASKPAASKKTATKKVAKPAAKKTPKASATPSLPREFSKRAVIIEMLRAKTGASLDEIVAKTSWQRHTVRGLLSTLRSKSGLAIERFDRDGGGHAYRISSK